MTWKDLLSAQVLAAIVQGLFTVGIGIWLSSYLKRKTDETAAAQNRVFSEELEHLKSELGADLERLRMRERAINEKLKALREAKNTISLMDSLTDAVFMDGDSDDPGARKAYHGTVTVFYNTLCHHFRSVKDMLTKEAREQVEKCFAQAEQRGREASGLKFYEQDSIDTLNEYREGTRTLRFTVLEAIDEQIERESHAFSNLIDGKQP